jgi:hypothetical protein
VWFYMAREAVCFQVRLLSIEYSLQSLYPSKVRSVPFQNRLRASLDSNLVPISGQHIGSALASRRQGGRIAEFNSSARKLHSGCVKTYYVPVFPVSSIQVCKANQGAASSQRVIGWPLNPLNLKLVQKFGLPAKIVP